MGGSTRAGPRSIARSELVRTTALTRFAYAALALAYTQAVLGAIVRITGSGMGCGDHWPKCHGYWLPPMNRMDLVIEVTHRYVAAALTFAVVLLLVAAGRARKSSIAAGRGDVLGPAAAAFLLVVAAALLGAATVKLELHAGAVLVHLALAMSLIATLAYAAIKSRALDGAPAVAASPRTVRGSTAAAALSFLIVMLGGATANIAGAAASCRGFPHCRDVAVSGAPLGVQVVHRVLAFLLLFHLLGMVLALRKRAEPGATTTWARVAFFVVFAQIVVAAAMVETGLPLHLRALHQALGTLVWLSVFVFAATAREGTRG